MLFELLQATPTPCVSEPPWQFVVFILVVFLGATLAVLLVAFLVFRGLLRAIFRR